jgi:hypothetical protein|tara:strand:- start:194 stop:301 length:108 start_codon:yes stop_codon:yes gene_type:complete
MTEVKANTYPEASSGVGASNLLHNANKYIKNGALS